MIHGKAFRFRFASLVLTIALCMVWNAAASAEVVQIVYTSDQH